MDEEKQIEEIKELADDIYINCPACLLEDEAEMIAEYVIERKGYRKASDVAREIFAEIERLMLDGEIGGKYPAKVIHPDEYADLKKKYESEGKRD